MRTYDYEIVLTWCGTDLPHNTKPSMLYTQEQLDMAQSRMAKIGRKPPAKFTKAKVRVAMLAVTMNTQWGVRPIDPRVFQDVALLHSCSS